MDYKSYFDVPADITYLNTPGNGLLPIEHHKWRRDREHNFFDVSSDLRDQQNEFISEVKRELSSLFHSDFQHTYMIPNFSFGLQTLLGGLPKGLKYALLEEDYPSLNYPVLSRQSDHVWIRVEANLEENIEECIRKHQVDVLLLSIVQYINGMKVDLEFVKRLKADFPDLIIIGDATQYLGTETFDFANSGFDAVGGSGYKWLMAGFGNGYLMISEQLKSLLYQDAQQGERPKEAMWSRKSILDTFFEPGHQDTLSHGTLLQSVLLLKEIGLQNVQRYIQEIQAYAYEKLDDRNLILPEIWNRKIKSSLINVQINPTFYNVLMENGIKCFPRGTGIRIGLHIYNTKEDIEKLITVIDKLVK